MATCSFALLLSAALSVLLTCSITKASLDDNTMLQDDEDIMITTSFSLQFRADGTCDSLYNTRIVTFVNTLGQAIASNINADCNQCGFSRDENFSNQITTCGPSDNNNQVIITFRATISDWDSLEVTASDLLQDIERRYTNSTVPVILSFTDGGEEVALLVEHVQTDIVVTGSGDGVGEISGSDGMVNETLPTVSTVVTGDSNAVSTDSSRNLRSEFSVLLTLCGIAVVFQYGHVFVH